MPVFTDPPVLVDPIAFSRQSRAEENHFIFQHLGIQYLVLVPGTTGSNGLGVFVSTDDGLTWAEVDAANKPPNTPRAPAVFYNSGAGTLEIFYRNASGHAIVTFTLAGLSSTWGTPGANLAANIPDDVFFAQKSDNSYVLFTPSTAFNHIAYYTNTAGVWSTSTDIFAGAFSNSGTGVKGGALTTGDVSFFTTIDNSSSVKVHRVDAAFGITSHTLGGGINNRTSVLLDEGNDNVVVNWNGNQEIYADIGTPLSAPTYTHYTLFSEGGSSTVSYPFLVIDADGKYNSLFTQVDYSTTPITDVLWQTVFDGISAWSTPVVYYDEEANPPSDSVPDQNNQFIHTGDAVLLSSGHLLVVIAMETVDGSPEVDHCTGFVLPFPAAPPTPQTLTLIKIVNGGPAAPSDFTLTAVGGSPETEITGPGPQVGPTDVNAGTFELFESDPGGATWDGPNAKWDSPTFLWDGSGQYRPVWDCNGAPMPTPTSVVVSPGGGGAIPLGVTQVPDVDPTFAPLLSNGPFEFLVGGFLYQVLWNSGNRLGMFRRQASVGGSFTEIDATNAPTGISGYGRATLRGTVIAVCYMLPGLTTVKIVEFNTVSSGWGTPTASLTLLATTATFAFEKRSDGTYVFVAGRPNVVYYATNTGGTWSGTHILLTLGSGIVVLGGVIDSADRIWLLLNTNSTTVGLYALSSTYVLGSSVATATLLFPGPPYPYIYYPQVALWGTDAVAVAYNTALTIGGAGVIRVKIGVGLSAPVFTSYDVYTVPAGTEQDYLMHPRDDGSGNLNLFFVHTNTGVVQVKQSTFDGASTWNTPSTFYDAVTTPPFAGSASQAISTIDPVPSNGWAVGAAMQTDQPTEITTAEIIQESSGGGSSDVVCTVINYFTGPAPAPPGPGQMNPVGCFELLRVDATLMPARHLPVRGSTR